MKRHDITLYNIVLPFYVPNRVETALVIRRNEMYPNKWSLFIGFSFMKAEYTCICARTDIKILAAGKVFPFSVPNPILRT